MERPFLSSRRPCEVLLIYKSCLTFRMQRSEYRFRTIIPAVFRPYQHIAQQRFQADDWEKLLGLAHSQILLHTSMHFCLIYLEAEMNLTISWMVWYNKPVMSLETLVKQLFICGTDLHPMQWNIHEPAVPCDICKFVRSKRQFRESSWVLLRTPSCLTCGNVIELHLFMWTLEAHSCLPAPETKDVELPRGEWPGGQTHAYQLDLTPIVHTLHTEK